MIFIPAAGETQGTETSSHSVPSKPQCRKKVNERSTEGVAVAAAGDIIAAEPFAHVKDSSVTSAMSVIGKSDVGFGNLEEALIDFQKFRGYPDSENGGMWLIGELQVAADLRAVGFRMLARANIAWAAMGGSSFQMNQLDVNENLASIREAKSTVIS